MDDSLPHLLAKRQYIHGMENITVVLWGKYRRRKIIDKYNEWIQLEVHPDGIILMGWVRSDDINIFKSIYNFFFLPFSSA